jgi:predicted transcriptional regulator
MSARGRNDQSNKQAITVLRDLLGSLELEVMEIMWKVGESTVQNVTEVINRRRIIAYTTVMTVMGHLVDKGLLARTMEGKRYHYRVAQSRIEFLRGTSQRMVRALVDDFGDLAIAEFLGQIENVDSEKLKQLRDLVRETGGESSASE